MRGDREKRQTGTRMENMDPVKTTCNLRLSPTTSHLTVMGDLQVKPCPLHATTCTLTQDLKKLPKGLVGNEGAVGWGAATSKLS